jgi:hypothetical protein
MIIERHDRCYSRNTSRKRMIGLQIFITAVRTTNTWPRRHSPLNTVRVVLVSLVPLSPVAMVVPRVSTPADPKIAPPGPSLEEAVWKSPITMMRPRIALFASDSRRAPAQADGRRVRTAAP